jgi:DNA polymerase/3'-5' exonuclease PolX
MELEKAKTYALALAALLRPACDQVVIAGSIRRQKPDVGDIELLVIPKGELLDSCIDSLICEGILAYRLNKRGIRTYGPKNKLMVHCPTRMAVDIFTTTPENWGMALFVRTGSKEWNIKAMSRFRQLGMQGHAYGGVTLSNGNIVCCPAEIDVFNLLGWAYIPPEKR